MTDKIETTIKIDNWDEKPTQEFDDGTKVAHAVVTLTEGNDGLTDGHLESVMYYTAEGTSTYVGAIRLAAELDGKKGAFTAVGEGGYDGKTASSTMKIVEGTGDLAGITGTVSSSSTQDDYPNMPLVIEYDLG
ncbi:MAG: DUF3224 domain-containing protein [Nocardioides sp.]